MFANELNSLFLAVRAKVPPVQVMLTPPSLPLDVANPGPLPLLPNTLEASPFRREFWSKDAAFTLFIRASMPWLSLKLAKELKKLALGRYSRWHDTSVLHVYQFALLLHGTIQVNVQ